ncbi:hypothetical protein, conserved [Plasmodium gonderi]|uniref:Ubiquitin fusion degradation protein 1 n=1 Tax=Plasmodium gonderi TaxID=77519 RepID=A0A1Y1JFJ6_PLAGO|nr:hypothetical protein, conserved [Plasmodium gonderi]GAW81309.1 hypothetical protein, conserved [Plasmodium gonderi]
MDDDFARAVNKFNSNLGIYNKNSFMKDLNGRKEKNEKKDKIDEKNINKLKEDLELHYIHNSNNKICQKFLTLPVNSKSDKLKDHSDKVILPVSILKILEKGFYRNEVEFPYTFSLKNVQNNYITHVCVLEFSSNEGIIHVSENVKENLGIKENNGIVRLLVTYANVPKCDFIKFEPLNENTNNIKLMKNLLQNELSLNYSTLTLGDYVHINNLSFYISELEPDNAVSLINTDITVDICEGSSFSEYKKNTLSNSVNDFYEPINTTDVTINSIIKKGMKKYKYIFHYSILELLKKDKVQIHIFINPSDNTNNNFDMYISFPPYDSVSNVLHHLHIDDFSKEIKINKDVIRKSLMLHFACFAKQLEEKSTEIALQENGVLIMPQNDDPFLEYILDQFFPHIMYIAISSTEEKELQYSLSLKVHSNDETEIMKEEKARDNFKYSSTINNSNTMNCTAINPIPNCNNNQTFIKCNNCLKDILENNMNMHQIHCLKNISICNICKKSFLKKDILNHTHCGICNEGLNVSDVDKHNHTWHTKIKCVCQKYFYKKQFIFHQALFCPKKIIFCSYCNIFTMSCTNMYNEDYILANFLDKFDHKENFIAKSVNYYIHLLHTNFSYFIKYINHTEHEKYCGSKSVNCTLCKTNMYRNTYLDHLMFFHNKDKQESFTIINENMNV